MKQLIAKIAENRKVAEGFYRMRLESAYLAKNSEPGQFVEVKVCDGIEPLLRRPLGVHRISKDGIGLLYEVVGKGTEVLSRRKAGEMLDVIGPLGNGFNIERTTQCGAKRSLPGGDNAQRTTILVAGGVGVAPLLALAESLVNSKRLTVDRKNIYVLIGACRKAHLLCERDFDKLGVRVMVATEDGSKGRKGLVTDLLREVVIASPRSSLRANKVSEAISKKEIASAASRPRNDVATIYACGPVGMLKTVAKLAHDARISCQVSLEERMACGVGVCLGCPVKVRRLASLPVGQFKQANRQTGKPVNYTYKMVCNDGPVFNAEEIIW